jgi:hypothetical protein
MTDHNADDTKPDEGVNRIGVTPLAPGPDDERTTDDDSNEEEAK